MSLLDEAIREKKFDVRMVEKNTSRGHVAQEEVEKAQKALKDDSDNAEWANVETLAQDLKRN